MKIWLPQDQVHWYLKRTPAPACHENITTDVAIVGGGMAGLSAAHAFAKKGKKVVLLEQYYCGSGASGKSSGFITPNAELSFTDFSTQYNQTTARTIWDFITSGVKDIRNNIEQHTFNCEYAPQDTIMVANSTRALKELELEYHNLSQAGYQTVFYTHDTLRSQINTKSYYGGVGYAETFGINSYLYCQEMKNLLQKMGVHIFEDTTVTAIHNHTLTTAHARITADYIVIATDRFMPQLGFLSQEVYHAQTFLMVSEQLTELQKQAIFPRQNLLVWDSDLVYTYFRITPHNQLLLGGGSVLTTYAKNPAHDCSYLFKKLTNYFNRTFPGLSIQFKQMWPGLIGLSKDIAPIAGPDKNKPYMYYITAAAGLPIAAALGRYSAEHLLENKNELDAYFSPYRSFAIDGIIQSVLGTRLTFALCNSMKKYMP